MRTSQKTAGIITTIGIDLGKNTFHLISFDRAVPNACQCLGALGAPRGFVGVSRSAPESPSRFAS
jgi:hypothetical protein